VNALLARPRVRRLCLCVVAAWEPCVHLAALLGGVAVPHMEGMSASVLPLLTEES
jgi:hypothetical protein